MNKSNYFINQRGELAVIIADREFIVSRIICFSIPVEDLFFKLDLQNSRILK